MANTQLGGAETIDSYRKKIMTILKKSGRTPVRPPSLSYLLAKILNVSVDTLCHDLSSVFTILNIIDHSVLVFKCLVYREEMTHLIKNVLRQL